MCVCVCKINSSETVSGYVTLSMPLGAGLWRWLGVSVWARWCVKGLTGARGLQTGDALAILVLVKSSRQQ